MYKRETPKGRRPTESGIQLMILASASRLCPMVPLTTVLRVPLLQIAQSLCQHLDRDLLIVGEQVLLSSGPGIVDERVGIRGNSSHSREDVAKNMMISSSSDRKR
jgi:hypothetical protein